MTRAAVTAVADTLAASTATATATAAATKRTKPNLTRSDAQREQKPAAAAAGKAFNQRSAPPAAGNAQPGAMLRRFASRRATPVTIRQMYDLGVIPTSQKVLLGAQFLHDELAVRLAHRAEELARLPRSLNEMPSVVRVRQLYERSFEEVVAMKRPEDFEEEELFTDLLVRIRLRHDDVLKLIARGILELRAHSGVGADDEEIRKFLNRFYSSRIGIRVLISHQVDLRYRRAGYVGVINPRCEPAVVVQDALEAVRSIAYRHYGDCPEVNIYGKTDMEFPYIDGHLFFCLFELLKNSVRATVETHEHADRLPPVRVVLASGQEDVTIKISDEGGGIPLSNMARVWAYMFTTAQVEAERLLDMEERAMTTGVGLNPIAGLGYGLPLSRLHARYFGGDLNLMSMENYGTDAYLHLSKLGDKHERLL